MRATLGLLLALLAVGQIPAQTRYALGVSFGGGPFDVYAISATGEIALHAQTPDGIISETATVDPGGRFFLTRHFPHDLDLFRINPDRTVSRESYFDITDRPIDYPVQSAISQDGRMILVAARDSGVTPTDGSWETFLVTNRLELRRTGYGLSIHEPGITVTDSWAISNVGDYTGVLLDFQFERVVKLDINPNGAISWDGSYIPIPTHGNHPLELSDDGRTVLVHSQAHTPPYVSLSIQGDGTVELRDSASPAGITGPRETAIWPNGEGVVIANDGTGLASVAIDSQTRFGPVLDADSPGGFSNVEALDISPDGTMVLADDQSSVNGFSVFSYFLSPDGTLTRTGGEYAKYYKLSTLDFIPDLAVPTLPGDANLDGRVDAADVVFLVNEAMPDDKPILLPPNFANADLDGDVDVDEDDLQGLVDLLLGPS